MKKFFIAVIFTALAFCLSSCYKSVKTDLGDGLISYTVKVDKQELVGLKTANGTEILKPVYGTIRYENKTILAAKDGKWMFFTPQGEKILEDMNVPEMSVGPGFFELKTAKGKYFYLTTTGTLSGPATEFAYYPKRDLVIKRTDGGFGVFQASTGDELMKAQYDQVVIAVDKKDNLGFYGLKGKTVRRITNGKERVLSTSQLNALKKDAENNKIPWPKGKNGFVYVSLLR